MQMTPWSTSAVCKVSNAASSTGEHRSMPVTMAPMAPDCCWTVRAIGPALASVSLIVDDIGPPLLDLVSSCSGPRPSAHILYLLEGKPSGPWSEGDAGRLPVPTAVGQTPCPQLELAHPHRRLVAREVVLDHLDVAGHHVGRHARSQEADELGRIEGSRFPDDDEGQAFV